MKELLEKLMEGPEPTGKGFITDFGQSLEARDAKTGEVNMVIPRYGYWDDKGRGKPEVIESSDDLDYLMKKYDVPEDRVVLLKAGK